MSRSIKKLLCVSASIWIACIDFAYACTNYRSGGVSEARLQVSTFHRKGEIAPHTWIDINVPVVGRLFPPAFQGDEPVPVETHILFHLSTDTGEPVGVSPYHPEIIKILIKGVEHYPVYSYLGFYGGLNFRQSPIMKKSDGTTYRSSEGYEFTGSTLDSGWKEVIYPMAPDRVRQETALFAIWDKKNEIRAVLACDKRESSVIKICQLTIKEEPIVATTNFVFERISDIDLIETRTREFLQCMMGGQRV